MSGYSNTVITVENNKSYEGFDIQSTRRCTPEVFGFKVCAELSADGNGQVTLRLIASTPLRDFSKTFTFNSNVEFEFHPIPRVRVRVSVRNFRANPDSITFDLILEGCIDIPIIGEKCTSATFPIRLPIPFKAQGETFDTMSSGDIALLLIAAQAENCQCR